MMMQINAQQQQQAQAHLQQPPQLQQQLAEAGQQPMEGAQHLVEAAQQSDEVVQQPIQGAQQLAEATEPPAEGSEQPMEIAQPSAEVQLPIGLVQQLVEAAASQPADLMDAEHMAGMTSTSQPDMDPATETSVHMATGEILPAADINIDIWMPVATQYVIVDAMRGLLSSDM